MPTALVRATSGGTGASARTGASRRRDTNQSPDGGRRDHTLQGAGTAQEDGPDLRESDGPGRLVHRHPLRDAGGPIPPVLAGEARAAGAGGEEVGVGAVEVAERLLQRLTIDRGQPGGSGLSLEPGQFGGEGGRGEVGAGRGMVVPAPGERPVVDVATATRQAREVRPLVGGRLRFIPLRQRSYCHGVSVAHAFGCDNCPPGRERWRHAGCGTPSSHL